ncbi:hypothetical protein ABZS81_16665 [Streptomyces sp. NPDC005318]|uniref:hypothetical protein n=1 Tax=Streptomyces sp. NPDC005318 TaxID=3157031 RepID=UPI00339EEBCE
MIYIDRDIYTVDPFTIPPDTSRSEWRAYLSRLFDFTGALISRGTLPVEAVDRLHKLRADIATATI